MFLIVKVVIMYWRSDHLDVAEYESSLVNVYFLFKNMFSVQVEAP